MGNKQLLQNHKATYVEHKLDGVDEPFKIKVLSQAECISLKEASAAARPDENGEVNIKAGVNFQTMLLAKALEVSEEDVSQWLNVATVEQIKSLLEKVMDVNGMGEQSAKTAYKSTQRKR